MNFWQALTRIVEAFLKKDRPGYALMAVFLGFAAFTTFALIVALDGRAIVSAMYAAAMRLG